MAFPLLTDGRVREAVPVDTEGPNLRKIERLQAALDDAEERATNGAQAVRAVAAMKLTLTPLYNALRVLFGEIDAVNVDVPHNAMPGSAAAIPAVWQSWLDKFGTGTLQYRFVSTLLKHPTLTATQLRVHMQCSNQSVYDTAAKLNKLGLSSNNSGKYSLREIL